MVLFILGTRFQPNPIVDRSLMVTGAQGEMQWRRPKTQSAFSGGPVQRILSKATQEVTVLDTLPD